MSCSRKTTFHMSELTKGKFFCQLNLYVYAVMESNYATKISELLIMIQIISPYPTLPYPTSLPSHSTPQILK